MKGKSIGSTDDRGMYHKGKEAGAERRIKRG